VFDRVATLPVNRQNDTRQQRRRLDFFLLFLPFPPLADLGRLE